MPAKYDGRTIDLEAGLATRIGQLREAAGWSYQQLADRMKAVGCEIHPSGIQKTEKSGRRVTVDEMMGYARAFDMSASELLEETPTDDRGELWSAYIGLEHLSNALRAVRREYGHALRKFRDRAGGDDVLMQAIRERHDRHLATHTEEARRQADRDGIDVSTAEALDQYMRDWGFLDVPAISTARDVLGDDHA